MKSKKTDETKEMLRAFKVLSMIAMTQDPDENHRPWQDVYMIAHSFSPSCPHPEWRGTIHRVEKALNGL